MELLPVESRIADIAAGGHIIWREDSVMSRQEYIWTQSVICVCAVLLGAALLVYAVWGVA